MMNCIIVQKITTVFISHKHDDLRDILGFLEKTYSVKVYIDSQDPNMPRQTSGEAAKRIKKRIDKCDKFILLATNGAIESKWCNWELGYGDAKKYKDHISLFPIKEKEKSDYSYKGNEYGNISIHNRLLWDRKIYMEKKIESGYYVREEKENDLEIIIPLEEWLNA